MKYLTAITILLFLFISCNTDRSPRHDKNSSGSTTDHISSNSDTTNAEIKLETAADSLIYRIGQAHGESVYDSYEMIKYDLTVNFGGNQRMDATIIMNTDMSRIKVLNRDGSIIIYDGKNVWLSPKDADKTRATFDIFTWPYFTVMAFKLDDPGTKYAKPYTVNQETKTRLTFSRGVGDTPDDWYDIVVDENDILKGAGYIVTYGGTTVEQAEKNAHAIQYNRYQNFDGVKLSTFWTFHNYQNNEIQKELIGNASLEKPILISKIDKSLFTVPKDAIQLTGK